jgi:integrase
VTHAVKRVRDRTETSKLRMRLVIGELKTARSRRTLFLTRELVELLRRHRARLAQERIAVGPAWREHDLIFSSALGTPLDPDTCRTGSRGSASGQGSSTGTCMSYATQGHH